MTVEICEVIITAPDPEWLATFTRYLVEQRLAAAGHILPAVRSIYIWQGRLHDIVEGQVSLHTRASLLPRIVEETDRRHPYLVPCVVAVPIRDGSPAYVDWILEQTRPTDQESLNC